METLEFEPLESKKLTVIFSKKVKSLSEDDIEILRDLIVEYKPDFAAEELGNRSIDDFYKNDQYSSILQDAGVLVYPVDISEYAKTSISIMVDEKRRLADMVDASCIDDADSEYVKAYADALRSEYEELREKEEISIRNDWMVKGILDCAKKVSKKEILCIFIGDEVHWEGMTRTLKSLGVETCTNPVINSNKIRNTYMDAKSTKTI